MATLSMFETRPGDAKHVPCSRPVYVDGCFGWLHAPVANRSSDIAVLLCPALKDDKVTGHRSCRLLADALAAAGYPTMRFDLAGTGDSRDIAPAEPWTTWRQNIHVAADWLRRQSGASRIVLCGLRFGATLAALAAEERDDVAGLILLAPVLRGRTYIRQLIVEAQSAKTLEPGDALALDGVPLPAATIEAISAVDLRKVALPRGCHVLVLANGTSPVLSECLNAWFECGVDAEARDFAAFEPMLRPVFLSHEADAQVSYVPEWLMGRLPPGHGRPPVAVSEECGSLRLDRCVEIPLRFGSNKHLFGMLCRPTGALEASIAVVIPNGSGAPHYGYARAGVDLARRLASHGIASLRIDFDGLGDSGVPGGAPTHVFETDRRPDIAAAIDALEQLGFRGFAMLGLCSGAYHALHAALADARISLQVLVNLPMFQWRNGDAIELMNWAVVSRVELLRRMLRRAAIRSTAMQSPSQGAELATRRQWFARRLKAAGLRFVGLSATKRRHARRCMRLLAPRVRTLFLVAERDIGIKVLERALGRNREAAGATIRVMPGIDHGLGTGDMRDIVVQEFVGFFGRVEIWTTPEGHMTSNMSSVLATRSCAGPDFPHRCRHIQQMIARQGIWREAFAEIQ
jgi:pimeloyl-ACP methyl ester carboxylesterase